MPTDPRIGALAATSSDPAVRLGQRVGDLERAARGRAAAESPDWRACAFAANWSSWTPPWEAAYMKLANGLVLLRGLATKSTAPVANETMFTLPTGFCPGQNLLVVAAMNDLFLTLTINSAGAVQIRQAPAGAGAWVALDGVRFRAER